MTTTVNPPKSNDTIGYAVAGLTIGCAVTTILWPLNLFFPPAGVSVATLGIVFSAMGISRSRQTGRGEGLSVAGLVLNIIATVGIGGWLIFWLGLFSAAQNA